MVKRKHAFRFSVDVVFDCFNYAFFSLIVLAVLYPLYWVCIASISDPNEVLLGRVVLWPKGLTFDGYKAIFQYPRIWMVYRNSLLYAVVGTFISLALILPAGYVTSRPDFIGRKAFLVMITITMFFSGGLIPTYFVIQNLGMENTMWALVIPGACSAYNVMVAKAFFTSNVPREVLESAMMDNCPNWLFFFRIALPISLPLVAVITVFTAVGHWNSYFSALIYLRDDTKYPLQMILREILVQQDTSRMLADIQYMEKAEDRRRLSELIKYGVIIVSSLPVLILYPFLQKYFVKGVMVGSLKG